MLKKLLALLLFLPLSAAAAGDPFWPPVTIGFAPPNLQGMDTHAMNAANEREAIAFNIPATLTLNEVTLCSSAVAGVITGAGQAAALQADSSGAPTNTDVEAETLASAPTAGTCSTWTGFSTSITANTQYWMVFKNTDAVPGTNYPTWSAISGLGLPFGSSNGAGTLWGWFRKYSTDGGSTWATGGNTKRPAAGMRLKFSDGSYVGLLITSVGLDTTDTVYGTRESGVMFATPATWPTANVDQVCFEQQKAGTVPSGGVRYKIYSGSSTTPTLVATSATIPAVNWPGAGGYNCGRFTTAYGLLANTTYRIVVGVVSGGSSGNDVRTNGYTVEDSAATKALLPFGGLKKTFSTDGVTFSNTDTKFPAFFIKLVSGSEFTVAPAGGVTNLGKTGGGFQ